MRVHVVVEVGFILQRHVLFFMFLQFVPYIVIVYSDFKVSHNVFVFDTENTLVIRYSVFLWYIAFTIYKK